MTRPPIPTGFVDDGYDPWEDDDTDFLPVNGCTTSQQRDDGPDPFWRGLALFGFVFVVEFAAVAALVWWRSA